MIGWSTGGLAAYRLAFEKWANAVVLIAKSAVGKTLFDVVGDADRALFVVERGSARGFDPEKVQRKAELDKRYYAHFSALATITAEVALEYDVKDVRDPKVKLEMGSLKKEKLAASKS